MATAASAQTLTTGGEGGGPATAPADVLAVFGITGDLAKVMTFRSLYRLERRGLIDCPIVGVAVDDWTVDQLRERAKESIVGTGERKVITLARSPVIPNTTKTSALPTPPFAGAAADRVAVAVM